MSFFGKVLDKLGFNAGADKAAEMLYAPAAHQPTTAAAPGAPAAHAPSSPSSTAVPAAQVAGGGASPASAATTAVDVTGLLDQKAAANAQQLNWRSSIVDMLKLLDLDSSLEARKELATELKAPADVMADSAKMNMWLHKALLQKLAANGGKVPAELLD